MLNHEEIGKHAESITKVKEGIDFRSEKDDWKKIEKNNVTNGLNVVYAKKEKIYIFCLYCKT